MAKVSLGDLPELDSKPGERANREAKANAHADGRARRKGDRNSQILIRTTDAKRAQMDRLIEFISAGRRPMIPANELFEMALDALEEKIKGKAKRELDREE